MLSSVSCEQTGVTARKLDMDLGQTVPTCCTWTCLLAACTVGYWVIYY